MSPILGIVGGILGLAAVWFFMIRGKKDKAQSVPVQSKGEVKKVTGQVVQVATDKKEELIRKLIARGALTEAEASKIRANIKEEPKQPQIPVNQSISGAASFGAAVAVIDQSAVAIMSEKYKSMVFTDEGIKFKLIPKKLGNTVNLEPSMPQRGAHLLVVEKDSRWAAYDPRLEAFISDETPQRAYSSVNCYELVSAVYANKHELWDKINTILIALLGCGMILVAIVAVDKLGK